MRRQVTWRVAYRPCCLIPRPKRLELFLLMLSGSSSAVSMLHGEDTESCMNKAEQCLGCQTTHPLSWKKTWRVAVTYLLALGDVGMMQECCFLMPQRNERHEINPALNGSHFPRFPFESRPYTRRRIGHSSLNDEEPPACDSCKTRMIVKHILNGLYCSWQH